MPHGRFEKITHEKIPSYGIGAMSSMVSGHPDHRFPHQPISITGSDTSLMWLHHFSGVGNMVRS